MTDIAYAPTLKFDRAWLDAIDVPVAASEDAPPHVTLFGSPTIGLLPVAGPIGETGMVAVWTCDRDGFDYASIPEAESAFVLEGVLRITPEGAESTVVEAGEGYYLPVGWAGRIEALQPVRKIYFLL